MSLKKGFPGYILIGLSLFLMLSIMNSSPIQVLADNNEISQNDISLEEEIISSEIIAYYRSSQENLSIDGIINENEYLDNRLEPSTGINIFLEHNVTHLFIALESPARGWVAIGINTPNGGMFGANFIMASVDEDNNTIVLDMYGEGHKAPLLDTIKGGTNDILVFNGSQVNGVTIIEFIMPLNSSDNFDFPLAVNQSADIYFAYNIFSDDFEEQHNINSDLDFKFFIAPEFVKVPEASNLAITTTSSTVITSDENFTLTAKLLEQESGNPLSNASIDYYLKGTYGNFFLGSGETDSNGEAILTTSISNYQLEEITFLTKYKGSLNFRVSTTEATFSFNYIESEENFVDWVPTFIGIIAVIILSIPWIGYSLAFYYFTKVIRNKDGEIEPKES